MGQPVVLSNWLHLDVSVDHVKALNLQMTESGGGSLDKLSAFIELAILGMGLGAFRHLEVLDLSVNMFWWSFQHLYYAGQSRKQGSLKSRSGQLEEHRLPDCIARAVILFRVVVYKRIDPH